MVTAHRQTLGVPTKFISFIYKSHNAEKHCLKALIISLPCLILVLYRNLMVLLHVACMYLPICDLKHPEFVRGKIHYLEKDAPDARLIR